MDKAIAKLNPTLSGFQDGDLTDVQINRNLHQMLPVIDVQFSTDSQSAQSRHKKAREILNHLRLQLGDGIYFLCILALQITPLSALQPETFYDTLSGWLNEHHIPSAFTEMARARVHNFLQKQTDSVQGEQNYRKRQSSSLHPEETTFKRRKGCSKEVAANLETMPNVLTGNTMQSVGSTHCTSGPTRQAMRQYDWC
ncbi:hypothetical protein BDP81DRAFT_435813 [Colletotrichum phormii]|uniref:Uncharacterized protein n=1 Tax=Colletotrichum phormii TaxID=359342 RepID=A0AAJ0EBT4_9PEZI|nr:uncharacterized protein BDP81DRAFT_435813 [Colletotrichum phormii]KAK1625440.1 hypothetical protein BDP81DRAFT_435813 [Colletotrichum phormii]